MNEVQKKLDTALRLLSSLSVSGDAVDVMAAAKVHLRDALELAKEPEVGTDG